MNTQSCLVCATSDDLATDVFGNADMTFRLCRSHLVRLALVDSPLDVMLMDSIWQPSNLIAGYMIYRDDNNYIAVWRDTTITPPGAWSQPIYNGTNFAACMHAIYNHNNSNQQINKQILIRSGEYQLPLPDGSGAGVWMADGWRYSGEGWKTILRANSGNYWLGALFFGNNQSTKAGAILEGLVLDGAQMTGGTGICLNAFSGIFFNRLYIRNMPSYGIRWYMTDAQNFDVDGFAISRCLFEDTGHDAVVLSAKPNYRMSSVQVRNSGFLRVGQRNTEGAGGPLYANGAVRLYYCDQPVVEDVRGYKVGNRNNNPQQPTYNVAFVHLRHCLDVSVKRCDVEDCWGNSYLYFDCPRTVTQRVSSVNYRYQGIYLEDAHTAAIRDVRFRDGGGGIIIGTYRDFNTSYYTYMMSSFARLERVSISRMQYGGIYGHCSYCVLEDVDVSECTLDDGYQWAAGERAGILLLAVGDKRDLAQQPQPTQPHGNEVATGGLGLVLRGVRSRGSKQHYGLSTGMSGWNYQTVPCGWLLEDCDFSGNVVAGMNLTGVEHTVRRVVVS